MGGCDCLCAAERFTGFCETASGEISVAEVSPLGECCLSRLLYVGFGSS